MKHTVCLNAKHHLLLCLLKGTKVVGVLLRNGSASKSFSFISEDGCLQELILIGWAEFEAAYGLVDRNLDV